MKLASFLFLFYFSTVSSEAYRLNVPRVLLPYHPNVPVAFTLEVTHPTGGCFSWRSTRPDIVSVTSLETGADGCSDKAEIRSVAKPGGIGSSELSSVIFAEDKGSGTTLSCGVTVDEIATISIETTTKVLFVDAAPARMIVDAFNSDGDRFSTLSEIALEWELTSQTTSKPLRIVPFEQSTYEAPAEIVKLEKNRRKGSMILIEGVGTGTATLTTKFSDSYLQKVKAHNVELAVVANLLLVPSQDIYMPVQAVFPLQVLIVKQRGTEVVPMPSAAYELKLDGSDIASLNPSTSTVRALSRGNTAIHLLSSHVDVRAKAGLRPPSTVIHVVDPESVQWHVSGGNWMLQTGKQYTLTVELLDEHGNVMLVSDNSKFDTKIDENIFRIDQMSKNGTWILVTPFSAAKTTVSTRFVAIADDNGKEVLQNGRVGGEQKITVVDPVKIIPPVVYLPYVHEKKSVIELTATGGSGLFDWSVGDGHVASIENQSGKLIGNSVGNTKVRVVDKRNTMLSSEAEVYVLDIAGIGFGETRRETFIGQNLQLNIKIFGNAPDGSSPIAVSDCRNVRVRVDSEDSSILRHIADSVSSVPTEGTGCGSVVLKGLVAGDTRVTISYGSHKATLEVAVYEKLEVSNDELAIGLNSDYYVQISGGPRPWLLDPAAFYRTDSDSSKVKVLFDNDKILLKCHDDETSEPITIRIGNQKSTSLPLPVHSDVGIVVCCAKPTRLEIYELSRRPEKCPATVHTMLINSHAKLSLRGHGNCAGSTTQLHSINGLHTKWSTSDSAILKTDQNGEVTSKGKEGQVTITAEVGGILRKQSAHLEISIADGVHVSPNRLVLWNEAVSKGTFTINGGSGHFLVESAQQNVVGVLLRGRSLTVTPKNHGQISVKVTDACLLEQKADVVVHVADIHSLAIEAPQYVEIGQEIEVEIVAQDETGATFEKSHRPLADAQLEANNDRAIIKKIDGLRYTLRAESIGTVSLSATAKSSSGRALNSRPKSVQIFSPIYLQPKRLTLIPEAKFQLEVIGGPQPTPPLEFKLNNSKIADIEANALISSKQELGYTSISGSVRVGDGHVSEDSVVLRVVSLGGVILSSSSRKVETGGKVNIRLRGLVDGNSDEEPFAFGGAVYPFKVTWSVSDPTVLASSHPLGGDLQESSENQFAIWFDALRSGTVTIKAVVEVHQNSNKHFVRNGQTFTAETTVVVEKGLSLVQPEDLESVSTIRLATNSITKLMTGWPLSSFSVPDEYSKKLTVTVDGQIQTFGREGSAAVAVRKLDSSDNETALIPITVSRIYSLDVLPIVELKSAFENEPLVHLPVGARIQLKIVARDAKGRKLSGSSGKVVYRPHRFDLTDIAASDNNRTLTITLKSGGDTVLRIGDASNSHISTFVRLSASESILPGAAVKYSNDLVVSDVICLQAKILSDENTHWSSKSSSEGRVNWIDEQLGVGQLSRAGETFIKLHAGNKQTIHSRLSIVQPHALRFTEYLKPRYVINDDAISQVFAVTAVTNATGNGKKNSIYGDCSLSQLESFSSIRAPFECDVTFVRRSKSLSAVNWLSAKPVFHPNVGYGCEIRKFDASLIGNSQLSIPEDMERDQYNIQLIARWSSENELNSVQEAKVLTPFHFAMSVEEKELVFSNIDQQNIAALSIWAPKYDRKNLVVKGCDGEIVSIEELYSGTEKHSAKGNVFYNVRLNVKSAALFSEHAKKCQVVVENKQTGQVIRVPVTVQLLDETAKHVYNALESRGFIDMVLIFAQKYSSFIPTMLWTCGIGIAILLAGIYLKMNVFDKSGSFNDTTLHQHTSIASSLGSSANSSTLFKDSPIFRSTPIAGSPNVNVFQQRERLRNNPHLGSSGDARLWSTDTTKRF